MTLVVIIRTGETAPSQESILIICKIWLTKIFKTSICRKRYSTDTCIQCICNVESGCRPLSCKWDVNSLSCGYFQVFNKRFCLCLMLEYIMHTKTFYQIKKGYYIDCYEPERRKGEALESAWKRCSSDYDCSAKCIKVSFASFI